MAYKEIIKSLYMTVLPDDESVFDDLYNDILARNGVPYNMNVKSGDPYDGKVLTSIESEPMILDTISKIVTIMFTANQVILQAPSLAAHY